MGGHIAYVVYYRILKNEKSNEARQTVNCDTRPGGFIVVWCWFRGKGLIIQICNTPEVQILGIKVLSKAT